MGQHTKIYHKFSGYTAADCDCKYCLHYGGKQFGCLLPVCCCIEERSRAGCVVSPDETVLSKYIYLRKTGGDIIGSQNQPRNP